MHAHFKKIHNINILINFVYKEFSLIIYVKSPLRQSKSFHGKNNCLIEQ